MENNLDDTRPNAPEPSGIGPLIGSIILIAILIGGGIYFFFDRINTARETRPIVAPQPAMPNAVLIDPQLEADISQVDAELQGFETELDDLETQFQ